MQGDDAANAEKLKKVHKIIDDKTRGSFNLANIKTLVGFEMVAGIDTLFGELRVVAKRDVDDFPTNRQLIVDYVEAREKRSKNPALSEDEVKRTYQSLNKQLRQRYSDPRGGFQSLADSEKFADEMSANVVKSVDEYINATQQKQPIRGTEVVEIKGVAIVGEHGEKVSRDQVITIIGQETKDKNAPTLTIDRIPASLPFEEKVKIDKKLNRNPNVLENGYFNIGPEARIEPGIYQNRNGQFKKLTAQEVEALSPQVKEHLEQSKPKEPEKPAADKSVSGVDDAFRKQIAAVLASASGGAAKREGSFLFASAEVQEAPASQPTPKAGRGLPTGRYTS